MAGHISFSVSWLAFIASQMYIFPSAASKARLNGFASEEEGGREGALEKGLAFLAFFGCLQPAVWALFVNKDGGSERERERERDLNIDSNKSCTFDLRHG